MTEPNKFKASGIKPLKKRKSANHPKKYCDAPMVNRMLNHPQGAYRGHGLYDASLCEHIPELYRGGKSDAFVAIKIGISKSTFLRWQKDYPEFKAAVDYGRTIAEMHWQDISETAVVGESEIQVKIWEIQMRNRYGYDQRQQEDKVNESPDEAEIRKVSEEKLESKLSDY